MKEKFRIFIRYGGTSGLIVLIFGYTVSLFLPTYPPDIAISNALGCMLGVGISAIIFNNFEKKHKQ